MQITFYINTSPTNKVSKSLTLVKTINIDIYEMVDVVNPVIRVDRTDIPSEANYMVCGEPLNRRYFITAMDFTNAKTTVIAGHVDVLSTYHGFLENTVLNYVRGEGDINEMDDSSYPISDYLVEQYFPMSDWTDIFTNLGSGRQYLLRTVHGDATAYPTIQLNYDSGTGIVGPFWCGRLYEESGETKYRTFTAQIVGDQLVPSPLITTSIVGTPQVNPNYKVVANGKMWRAAKGDADFDFNPEFYFLGNTT